MRRLLYVPIMHTGPDFGTLAQGIEERARVVVGSSNWQKHKDVVERYWQAIGDYWEGEDVSGFKIFQDGMPVDGAVGKNIVKDLAEQGSINHKIVEQLLEKGAALVQTENPELLKEEYLLTSALVRRKSFGGSLVALSRYKWRRDALLRTRDAYVIKRIHMGLQEGETGICFMGASHQIVSSLPKDIEIRTLKDPEKVRRYAQKFMSKKWEDEVNMLEAYLTMPIKTAPGESHE